MQKKCQLSTRPSNYIPKYWNYSNIPIFINRLWVQILDASLIQTVLNASLQIYHSVTSFKLAAVVGNETSHVLPESPLNSLIWNKKRQNNIWRNIQRIEGNLIPGSLCACATGSTPTSSAPFLPPPSPGFSPVSYWSVSLGRWKLCGQARRTKCPYGYTSVSKDPRRKVFAELKQNMESVKLVS